MVARVVVGDTTCDCAGEKTVSRGKQSWRPAQRIETSQQLLPNAEAAHRRVENGPGLVGLDSLDEAHLLLDLHASGHGGQDTPQLTEMSGKTGDETAAQASSKPALREAGRRASRKGAHAGVVVHEAHASELSHRHSHVRLGD